MCIFLCHCKMLSAIHAQAIAWEKNTAIGKEMKMLRN